MLLRLALQDDLPEEHAARERFWAERFTTGQRVLQRAQARGELRPGLDYRLTIETLIGALYVRLLLTREPVDGTVVGHIVDLVLAGLHTPSGQPALTSPPDGRSATQGHDQDGGGGRLPGAAGRRCGRSGPPARPPASTPVCC